MYLRGACQQRWRHTHTPRNLLYLCCCSVVNVLACFDSGTPLFSIKIKWESLSNVGLSLTLQVVGVHLSTAAAHVFAAQAHTCDCGPRLLALVHWYASSSTP